MNDQGSKQTALSIHSVGILGGGTAGYFAALALKRRFPALDVTLIESRSVPIIGVGEATTTLMPPFLHRQLGLDVVELYREVRPTWKLGIKFDWGLPDADYYFTYPFGEAEPVESHVYEGDLRPQSFTSLLMTNERTPVLEEEGRVTSLLPRTKFAYHLDNARFVAFLARNARDLGVQHRWADVDDVELSPDGERVQSLRTRDGEALRFDLYVDASGFRSALLERALGTPFIDYKSSLFCDTAIVAEVPQADGVVSPYTLAQTMDAGWCWKIPVEGEDHRGYVHSSEFLDEERAIAEMRAKNPTMGEPRIVRFRSGRHRDFWRGNVVAIGNAYGFVEPLESTALHMVIVELGYVIGCLAAAVEAPPDTRFASEAVGKHWDFLRWFLALHYKFNRKSDSAFWRACRESVDVSGLDEVIERFGRFGPYLAAEGERFQVGDPAFGYSGMMMMLLGQKVPFASARPQLTREAWDRRLAARRALVERALPQAQALEALRRQPELLVEFATSRESWCCRDAERIEVSPLTGATAHPKEG